MTPSETRQAIEAAVRLLLDGDVVGIPTETVYGLAADAANPQALEKIFKVKGRPADHPLIVHLASDQQLEQWAIDVPDAAWELAEQFWPGPLTLILKRRPGVSDLVTGGQETVGLRVPGHPLALELLRQFSAAGGSGGLAAPSANRFGRISPTTARHVRDDLGSAVPLVLDGGPCHVGIESTIVDISSGIPAILRPGVIGADALSLVLGPVGATDLKTPVPRVSGSLEAHYAPTTPLRLLSPTALADAVTAAGAAGQSVAVLSRHRPGGLACRTWIPASLDARTYGHDLYANLRALDADQAAAILIEAIPNGPEWTAVADRLRRATAGSGR